MPSTPPSFGNASSMVERHDIAAIVGVCLKATIAPTDGHDTASLHAMAPIVGTMARSEGHDVGSLAGALLVGTLSRSETHDTGSLAATFRSSAVMARAEGHDLGGISAAAPGAILTHLEGGDVLAAAGVFAAVATMAAVAGSDFALIAGAFTSGAIVGIEKHDAATFAGRYAAAATLAYGERRDTASIAGIAHNVVTLTPVEGRDTLAATGHFAEPSHLAATEGRDAASIVGLAGYGSVASAMVEGHDRANIVALALGIPPSMQPREGRDVAGFFGSTSGLAYNVYANMGLGDPINYTAPIATVTATTWTSSTLACPGTWSFGVRAFSANGEEQNLDCEVTFVLDAAGNDITNRPAAPIGLRVFPTPNASIRAEWYFPPTTGPRTPTGFYVYCTPGPTISYAVPAATVAFNSAILSTFVANIPGLTNGTTYSVAVRAYNAVGAETNTVVLSVTAVGVGPLPVTGLSASAVV